MCSLGARLLRGETSSSICSSTMIDNITNTSKGAEQAVGGSLATALRDRQAFVIPIQPNRSLPVRPVPHHTPSRTTIVKSSLGRNPRNLVATATYSEALVIDAPQTIEPSVLQVDISTNKKEGKPEEEDSIMKRSLNNQNAVSTSENLIDISRSPERIDLSDEISICPSRLDSSSPGCWVHGFVSKEKRKRRRKGKRELEEEDISGVITEIEKTVPPLRLKKIQTLQEHRVVSGESTCQEISREINDSGFNIQTGFIRSGAFANFESGISSKYRIVTGDTPPYEERIDSSSEPRLDTLDAAKLRYRQTKLKLKLRQLRRKTVELGKEMLRTVFTSSSGLRASRLRQTMNRYEGQIKHLEKLLNELPKAVYVEESVQPDWKPYQDVEKVHHGENCEQSAILSPARAFCNSNSSSVCSSPSLEPPKLSPRSPTNYEAVRSPSEIRNSPPVLPRVYITIADCIDDAWDDSYSCRGHAKHKNRSPLAKPLETIAGPSSPVITTTTETIIKDKVELVLDPEHLSEKPCVDISKNDLEILEVYEEPKVSKNTVIEAKARVVSPEGIKPVIKRLSSPQPVVIDTTSVDTDYEAKPQLLHKINEATATVATVDTQPITSSCKILGNIRELRAEKDEGTKQKVVTVREDNVVESQGSSSGNGFGIAEQFPTLANWIARLSKKQVPNVETSNKLPEPAQVEDRPSAFQVFSSDISKPATPKVPQTAAAHPVVDETVNVASQWRADRWQERSAQDQQSQTLPQSYAPTLPLPPQPPQSSLRQEFCSPIAMARLYTRNYAIDPYSVAYGYSPTIAAAAATASLWNSAAILQYPLMRPNSSLLNNQQARISPGSLQFPGNPESLQRPNYRVSVMQHNEGKRLENSMNYLRDAKIQPSGYSTTFEQAKRASAQYHQALATAGHNRGISCNPVNGQTINYRNCLQHQQQQQQQQQQQTQEQQQRFARATYPENSMRLPVSGSSWRPGHVLGAMGRGYNYGSTSPWTSAATGNILNPLARTSTPGFVSASALSMSSSRPKNIKDSGDNNARNCETPHLGKVNYSPNTMRNLECSNCGLTGSMFKCLGCEVAFYCDENCQARHWSRHVISCPKKMPKLKKLVH